MIYRTLGKTELRVSVVGIETHQWSGMGGKLFTVSEVRAFLKRAKKLGMNFIDTGECYFFHASERLIGEALGKERKKFVIATKFGHQSFPMGVKSGWDETSVAASLDRSLKALNTTYIDLYQLHITTAEDMQAIRKEKQGIMRALAQAKREGKIRHVGIVLGDDALLDADARVLSFAVKFFGVETVQIPYSRLDVEAERKILPLARKHHLGVIARAPLSKGYLSSRFKPNNKNYDAKKMRRVAEVKAHEVPAGADLAEWAIGWLLKNPLVQTVVPGCTALPQLDSTVRALQHAPKK